MLSTVPRYRVGMKPTERVQPEERGGHRRWGQRGSPDADVEPPVHQTLELLGHTDFDLVDLQIGVLLLDLVQDQRHRVVAGIHHSHPQARSGTGRALRCYRGPFDVGEDLSGVDQEDGARGGQSHVVGGAVHQGHTDFPFQTLQTLAQRGLHDVLAGGGPTEMQLLGKGDEIAQLPKLHVGHP
jgi:hypothetical protein